MLCLNRKKSPLCKQSSTDVDTGRRRRRPVELIPSMIAVSSPSVTGENMALQADSDPVLMTLTSNTQSSHKEHIVRVF